MSEKKITIDGYEITYYEGGKGDNLVLIHGFGDSKASFLQISKWLTSKYRVILPEVPGFGVTTKDENRKYGIRNQVEFFDAFFNALKLEHFHLGGNSMGGHISVAYSILHPEKVRSLTLLNAAGVRATETTPYNDAIAPIKNAQDFELYMSEIFYQKPFVPKPVKSYMIEQSSLKFAWFNRIRKDIREEKDYILNDVVSQIKLPVVIIWGDYDKVVVPAVGELYHKLLPQSELIIFKDCGHVPQYERPQETSEVILKFLQNQNNER